MADVGLHWQHLVRTHFRRDVASPREARNRVAQNRVARSRDEAQIHSDSASALEEPTLGAPRNDVAADAGNETGVVDDVVADAVAAS